MPALSFRQKLALDRAQDYSLRRQANEFMSEDDKNFTGYDFSGLDLSNLDLQYANLKGCTLFGANLTNALLCRADLSYCSLEKAVCISADFSNADLCAAMLDYADLTNADFTNARLWYVTGPIATATFNSYPAWVAGGRAGIGCQTHSIEYWYEHYENIYWSIGPQNRVDRDQMLAYIGWLRLADTYLKTLAAVPQTQPTST